MKAPELEDESDTVDDSKFSFHVRYGQTDDEVGVVRAPGGWDLRVVWSALSCRTGRVVRVEGQDGRLSAVVDPGPLHPPAGAECDAVGDVHAVDLKLSTAPSPDIDISLVE